MVCVQNMLEHEDEIKARPPRTWFQSERQKQELKRRTAAAAAGQEDGDDGGDGEDGKVRPWGACARGMYDI